MGQWRGRRCQRSAETRRQRPEIKAAQNESTLVSAPVAVRLRRAARAVPRAPCRAPESSCVRAVGSPGLPSPADGVPAGTSAGGGISLASPALDPGRRRHRGHSSVPPLPGCWETWVTAGLRLKSTDGALLRRGRASSRPSASRQCHHILWGTRMLWPPGGGGSLASHHSGVARDSGL